MHNRDRERERERERESLINFGKILSGCTKDYSTNNGEGKGAETSTRTVVYFFLCRKRSYIRTDTGGGNWVCGPP